MVGISAHKRPIFNWLIGLSEVIPAVSCALYAGHVIDMNEKKKLLLICTYLYVFLIGLLLIPAFFNVELHFSGHEITYYIYGVIFFTGIVRAFIGPIVPSMIPKIVQKVNLPSAITLNQGTFLISSVCGHAAGGFLIGLVGVKWTLIVIISLISIASIFFWQLNKQFSGYKKKKLKYWKVCVKEFLIFLKLKKFSERFASICLRYSLEVPLQ